MGHLLRASDAYRTMRAFKPLRIVVDCFFAAAPLMSSVIALIFFFIFITGLVGMQVCPWQIFPVYTQS